MLYMYKLVSENQMYTIQDLPPPSYIDIVVFLVLAGLLILDKAAFLLYM